MQYQTQSKWIFQINIFNYILYILFLNFEHYEVSNIIVCQNVKVQPYLRVEGQWFAVDNT